MNLVAAWKNYESINTTTNKQRDIRKLRVGARVMRNCLSIVIVVVKFLSACQVAGGLSKVNRDGES
jgi:hypothetical protein